MGSRSSGSESDAESRDIDVEKANRSNNGSAIASEPKHPEIRPEGLQQWVLQHHKENIIKEIDGDHLENQIWDFIVSWLLPTGIARKLLSNINGSKMSDSGPIFRISFAELQRMRMRKLEVQLIKHAVHMAKFGVEPQGWENDLATYGT
ncbi:hypothetical protein N0V82_004048 [Gnomoniopsis sp. IMI 355080]|nr:hypothetical protein N0V82_004048 [Gnomoniopsis sp. IMI 355080]